MRTHLNTKAGSRVLVMLAVAALALTASACGGGKKSPTTSAGATGSTGATGATGATGSATVQWAGSVCSAFTAWKTSLEDAKSTVTSGGISKDNLKAAGNEVKDATDTLAQSLQGLGAPKTTGGAEAKQDLANFETSISFSVNKIKDAVSQKPTSASELQAAVTTVKQAEATMVTALNTAVKNLKQFDPSGELEQAFHNAPSCSPYF
jgi:hypothetical protein